MVMVIDTWTNKLRMQKKKLRELGPFWLQNNGNGDSHVDKQIVDVEKELGKLGPPNCKTMAMVIDM
jgi:hypothetical protein